MTRRIEVQTGFYALAFRKDEKLVLVINSDKHFELKAAEMMLADRIANDEAFPNEHVVELWVSLQWFGEHSSGEKTFPAYLFPKEIE